MTGGRNNRIAHRAKSLLLLAALCGVTALAPSGCRAQDAPAATATAQGEITRPTVERASWNWQVSAPAKATLQFDDGVYRADVSETDGVGWHAQLLQAGLTLRDGQKYTLNFSAKTEGAPRKMLAQAGLDGEPWSNNGLYKEVELTTEWQEFSLPFVASKALPARSRVVFELGGQTGAIQMKQIHLKADDAAIIPPVPRVPDAVLNAMPRYGKWQSSYIGGGGYMINVIPTGDPKIYYAQPDICGAYRSEDGGQSWHMIHDTLPAVRGNQGVRGMVSDPRDPNFIAMAVGDRWTPRLGVFVSKDGGKSWKKTLDATFFGNGEGRWNGQTFRRDPANVNRLVVASVNDGFFESLDNGATWKNLGLKDLYPAHIQFDRSNPKRMWLCAESFKGWTGEDANGDWKSAFYRTDDGGVNWTKLSDQSPLEMVQDPANAARFYGIFDNKTIRTSDDAGQSWQDAMQGLPRDTKYQSLSAGPNFVLISSQFGGVIFRLNAGSEKWRMIERKKVETAPYWWGSYGTYAPSFGSSTSSIVIDPRDANHWFLTDWYSVWQTRDAGANWTRTSQGLELTFVHNLTQDVSDPQRVYAGLADLGLAISRDGGRSFERITSRKPALRGDNIENNIKDISYADSNPKRLYAVGSEGWRSDTLFNSDVAGESWKKAPLTGLPAVKDGHLNKHYSSTVAVHPRDANDVTLTLSGTVAAGDGGPYRSTDGGKTWKWDGAGLPNGEFYRTNQAQHDSQLAISGDDSMVTVSVDKYMVHRRSKAGEPWMKVTQDFGGAPWGVTADTHHDGRFYMGIKGGGAWRSDDGGASWRRLNTPGVSSVSYIEIDRAKPDRIAAGTLDGVIYSADGGENWTMLDQSLPARVEWLELAFVGDRLLVGTGGSGIFGIDLPKG